THLSMIGVFDQLFVSPFGANCLLNSLFVYNKRYYIVCYLARQPTTAYEIGQKDVIYKNRGSWPQIVCLNYLLFGSTVNIVDLYISCNIDYNFIFFETLFNQIVKLTDNVAEFTI